MKLTIKRSFRKTISIEVRTNSEVIIRAPKLVPKLYINSFIENHKAWISKKLSAIENNPYYRNLFKVEEGHHIYFLGEVYKIRNTQNHKAKIHLSENECQLSISNAENDYKRIITFFKKSAQDHLKKRIHELSDILNLSFNNVRITSAKTRWGSCSYQNNINLSYRLMMLPEKVIDYVIIHELVHTKIKNHSKQFWNEVAKYDSEYKQSIAWINEHRRSFPF